MTVQEIRLRTYMNKLQFATALHIPYESYLKWERGERKPPIYLVELIEWRVMRDPKFKKKERGN